MTRIQVIVDAEERELFRLRARSEGMSLSAWLRAAARERLEKTTEKRKLHTSQELQVFFGECDQRESNQGQEPDWESHLSVIQESRSKGASTT